MRITEEFEDAAKECTRKWSQRHTTMSKQRHPVIFSKHVKNLVGEVEEIGNPFLEESNE